MALDHYAPCPCGSGKKLKFCKCVEQPHELERVIKLIEGGQEIAAIDRINHLLAKTPNAAWLLALKAELSLGMGELQMFKETVERFLKLKPDNPLALILKAISSASDGQPVEQTARYLLQGIAESREALPAVTLPAFELLLKGIAQSEKRSMLSFWSGLWLGLKPEEAESDEDIYQDATLNLLAKQPYRKLSVAPAAQCKERLAEVLTLEKSMRFEQAEVKLRAILRDFPDEPVALQHLFDAQLALLDQSGATSTARKLSEQLQLTFEERCFFAALALELEPGRHQLSVPITLQYAEVDSEQRIQSALSEFSFVVPVHNENLLANYAALVGDEIPARAVWSIQSMDEDAASKQAEQTGVPTALKTVGWVALFGKQTDKPARVLLRHEASLAELEPNKTVRESLQMGQVMEVDKKLKQTPYPNQITSQSLMIDASGKRPPSMQEKSQLYAERFLSTQFVLLENQTPLEAVQDEKKRFAVYSLLYHLESEQGIYFEPSALREIYAKLELDFPGESASVERESILGLIGRLPESMSDDKLMSTLVASHSYGATRLFYWAACEVRQRESLADRHDFQATALSGLVAVEADPENLLLLLAELYDRLRALGQPGGQVALQQLAVLNSLQRPAEGQALLEKALKDNPQDPYIMPFLQYAMSQNRGGGPNSASDTDGLAGRMLGRGNSSASAGTESSGLVLPGQGAEQPSGESKLWLPGS